MCPTLLLINANVFCRVGGVGADAHHVTGLDQGHHRRGGRLRQRDLGAAPSAGQGADRYAQRAARQLDGEVRL